MRITEGYIKKRDKGRNYSRGDSCPGLLHFLIHISAFLPVLASCSGIDGKTDCMTGIELTKVSEGEVTIMDLFFFNDDELGRLDSYQRFSLNSIGSVSGASKTGNKIVAAIANPDSSAYLWSDISSFSALFGHKARLDDDNPAKPIMSGIGSTYAGKDTYCSLTLRPVMSEVILKSICCDFSGRSYEKAKLENVKVYLTNVNSSWPVFADSLNLSSDYINVGRLDSTMISKMKHPEYIYRDIGTDIGKDVVNTDLHFYCYPNSVREESMGSPFTRLVIEGEIDGKTYYYPLNVNRHEDAEGIVRNCRYVLDVKLTRRGTMDPDTAIDTETANVSVSITDWSEKEAQYVSF